MNEGRWRLSRTTTLNLDGQTVLGDRTKTGEARLVHLQSEAVAAFRAQSARVAAQRLKTGALWQDHDLVLSHECWNAQTQGIYARTSRDRRQGGLPPPISRIVGRVRHHRGLGGQHGLAVEDSGSPPASHHQ